LEVRSQFHATAALSVRKQTLFPLGRRLSGPQSRYGRNEEINALEDKIDDSKDSICEELERVFDRFSKYYITILMEDLNVKVGKEAFSNPKRRIEFIWRGSMSRQ
jgi:hypothetical protein